jgi:hypothetical protein
MQEKDDPSYSCSVGTTTCDEACICETHYCCIEATTLGLPSQCSSDNTLACPPGVDSFGYQCGAGVDLSNAPSLECGTPTPDPDGVHDDYCCAYD